MKKRQKIKNGKRDLANGVITYQYACHYIQKHLRKYLRQYLGKPIASNPISHEGITSMMIERMDELYPKPIVVTLTIDN
jgi:hypothetical protein